MAGEDFLAQAALAALQGFERAYVPFKQTEYEDRLARQRYLEAAQAREDASAREFERESYVPTEEIPSSIRNVLFEGQRTPTGEERLALPKFSEKQYPSRIRKEFISPAVSLAGQASRERTATERLQYLKNYVPKNYYKYAGSAPDLTKKAFDNAYKRVQLDSQERKGDPFAAFEEEKFGGQERLETYFEEEARRLGISAKPIKKDFTINPTTPEIKQKSNLDQFFEGLE